MIYYILLTDEEEMKEKKRNDKVQGVEYDKKKKTWSSAKVKPNIKKITRFNFIRQVFFFAQRK